MNLRNYLTQRNFLIFAALVSIFSLCFAYVAQYFFSINPCILCLYERYFYWAIILLGLGGFFSTNRLFFLLLGATLVAGTIFAIYHVGVELHWWQGTAACHGVASKAASIEDLRAMLKSKPMARCDQANWHIIGISVTYINLAWFLGFLGLWSFTCFNDQQSDR